MVTFCNKFIVPATKQITKREKWDYRFNLINQQIWRIYMGRMINLFIFVSIQSQRAADVEILVP